MESLSKKKKKKERKKEKEKEKGVESSQLMGEELYNATVDVIHTIQSPCTVQSLERDFKDYTNK